MPRIPSFRPTAPDAGGRRSRLRDVLRRGAGLGLALGLALGAACQEPRLAARCGDGRQDPGESCDGSDLGGISCQSLGFYAGTARCTRACVLDTTSCAGRCGDGRVQLEAGEECDGDDLRSLSCEGFGYNGGELRCDATCQFDRAGCEPFGRCGDGTRDVAGGEECDGDDLGGLTCELPWDPAAAFSCTGRCRLAPGSCTTTRTFAETVDTRALDIVQDAEGNYYVTGFVEGALPGETHAGGLDSFLAKLDASGSLLWAHQWGVAGDDEGDRLALDPSGDIWVASSVTGAFEGEPYAGGSWDLQLRRFQPDGTPTLTRQWGTPGDDFPASLVITPTGEIFLAGVAGGALGSSHAGNWDFFLAQVSADGSPLWVEQWGTPEPDRLLGMARDAEGAFYLAGATMGDFDGNNNAGYWDALLLKVGPEGAIRWSVQIGDFGNDQVHAVALAPDGEPVIAGWTESALALDPVVGSMDLFVARYRTSGERRWLRQGGSTKWDGAWDVAVDDAGAAYVVGVTAGHAFGWVNGGGESSWGSCDDLLLIKYGPDGEQLWARQWGGEGPEDPSRVLLDRAGNLVVIGSLGRGSECETWTGVAAALVVQTTPLP